MHAATETNRDLRRRIIAAADQVIRERGIGGTTTREIARAAGCSEGSIYVHFEDKIDLLIAVVVERDPLFAELLDLPGRVGESGVEENIASWLEHLLALMQDNLPIFLALLADRALFARFAARVHERRTGLLAVADAISAYIAAEQKGGRISTLADPEIIAMVLVGACRDHALSTVLKGEEVRPPDVFARAVARLVVAGLGGQERGQAMASHLRGGTQ
jgi:AcrR family transcriptional regulator